MIWFFSLLLLLVFTPSLWVRWVMKRYANDIADMPGTGGELARHLIERFELKGVEAEITELGCLLYTSPSPRDRTRSRMPSSA